MLKSAVSFVTFNIMRWREMLDTLRKTWNTGLFLDDKTTTGNDIFS